MNKNPILSACIVILMLCTNAAYAQKQKTSQHSLKGWKLVWKDEFKGNKLDPDSWRRCKAGGSDWDRHMSPLDSLCRVEDGALQLWGIPNLEGVDDARPFITGGVYSEGLHSVKCGRVDVRARFDCATGFWPAIWLMPDIKTPWPTGGEIDIMEHLSHEDIAYQTVHTAHTYYQRNPKGKHGNTTPIDKTQFNIYSVEVNDSNITFYINGTKTYTYQKMEPTPEGQFPFADHPFYIILSAQLGGSWVGKVNIEELPVKMEIDYVRFYERR